MVKPSVAKLCIQHFKFSCSNCCLSENKPCERKQTKWSVHAGIIVPNRQRTRLNPCFVSVTIFTFPNRHLSSSRLYLFLRLLHPNATWIYQTTRHKSYNFVLCDTNWPITVNPYFLVLRNGYYLFRFYKSSQRHHSPKGF